MKIKLKTKNTETPKVEEPAVEPIEETTEIEVPQETIEEIAKQVVESPKIKKPFEMAKAVDKAEDKAQEIEDETTGIIKKVSQQAVEHTLKTSEDIQKKVIENAEERVLSEIEIQRSQQMLKVIKATYDANKDACENLGLDADGRPMWQIRIAKMINNFWFVIWAFISSFTLTPVIFFLKRIGTQVRSAKLTWILAFVFYIMIVCGLVAIIILIVKASTGGFNHGA